MKKKVGVLLYPGAIFFEVALALELVADNFDIVALSPDGKDLRASHGLTFSGTLSFAEGKREKFAGLLVPGGNPDSIANNDEVDELLQEAYRSGAILAAICAGPSLLGKSGILKGRKIAHGYRPEQFEFLAKVFAGVTLTEEPFLHDGPFLTAKPWAHIDFAIEFAERLGVVEPKRVPALKAYYKGFPFGRTRPLALAVIRNAKGQCLFHEGHDTIKNEKFYRPLGGGIEFGESAAQAIHREVMEELGEEIELKSTLGFFENIFEYEGKKGHELIVMLEAIFKDLSVFEKPYLNIVEGGRVLGRALWKSLAEIESEGAKLYPVGLESKLREIIPRS